MVSIIALEEMIVENEAIVAYQKRQLASHEAGDIKLSRMAKASTENTLEIAEELISKYKAMLEELQLQDAEELAEKERLFALAERKQYFDAQESRIKLNVEESNDKKLEVMRIIGELPSDVQFEDDELFEIATKSIDLNLPDLKELSDKLDTIKNEFESLINKGEKKELKEMETIDFLIPIIVLHFHLLLSNIRENIEEKNTKALNEQKDIIKKRDEKESNFIESLTKEENRLQENKNDKEIIIRIRSLKNGLKKLKKQEIPEVKKLTFSGFPRYQDWWIRELWLNHQAYIALYKWKNIITNLCQTTEQKKAWSIIFDRWIFIKKLLNDKGQLAFNYNFAFDSLLASHVGAQEELEIKNILSMEFIINEITKKEDFSKNIHYHNIDTKYLKFKRSKLVCSKEE